MISVELYRSFISEIDPNSNNFVVSSLDELVVQTYDLLDEINLNKLISKVVLERQISINEETLKAWDTIMDVVKKTGIKRKEVAMKHLSQLLSYTNDSTPQNLMRYVKSVHDRNEVDRTFKHMLQMAKEECLIHGQEDIASLYQFTQDVISRLESSSVNSTNLNKSNDFKLGTVTTPTVTSSSNKTQSVSASLVNTSNSNNHKSIPKDTTITKLTSDEGVIKNEQSTVLSNNMGSKDNTIDSKLALPDIVLLEKSGHLLHTWIQQASNNATKLKELISHTLQTNTDIHIVSMKRVIQDNIEACQCAGYVNKVKLYEFISTIIDKYEEEEQQQLSRKVTSSITSTTILNGDDDSDISDFNMTTTIHSPQFLNPIHPTTSVINDTNVTTTTMSTTKIIVSEPVQFIDTSSLLAHLMHTNITNKKKKSDKKFARIQSDMMIQSISKHLETYKWVTCDHFIPLELIKRVRIEANLFTTYYEQSEIWVGKESDLGAQISVPSVRGDKVLWMCGGHTAAPEGVTRTIKTANEIEPCKLDIKASAPIKKFNAMKELISAIDTLIDRIKPKVPTCQDIYERSDVMLAVYPGGGSRFAKHIDNTTGDGRRLTVLIYLNPIWEPSFGGALRLTVPVLVPSSHIAHKESSIIHNTVNTSINNGATKQVNTMNVDSTLTNTTSSNINTNDSNSGKVVEDTLNQSLEALTVTPIIDMPLSSNEQLIDIYPCGGRVVIFYSADIPHEVLPAYQHRHAITIWYYDRVERTQAITLAKEKGRSQEVSQMSVQSHQQAKEFIAMLMQDKPSPISPTSTSSDITSPSPSSLPLPSLDEMNTLRHHMKLLTPDALTIVTNITGAPSVASFKEGFELLTPYDIQHMRYLFHHMGLQ